MGRNGGVRGEWRTEPGKAAESRVRARAGRVRVPGPRRHARDQTKVYRPALPRAPFG